MASVSLALPNAKDIIQGLKTHKRCIALYALFGSLAFGLYGLATPRSYLASSHVLLTPKGNSAEANLVLIEGQKRLILSQEMLSKLVEREKLAINLVQDDFLTRAFNALTSSKAVNKQEQALANVSKALSVTQSEVYTLQINAQAPSAAQALRLSQSLTQIYLERQLGLGDTTSLVFAKRFSARLEELSLNLRQAEERLYKLKNDIRKTGSEDDLSFQTNQLSIARAKTAELRERVEKFVKFQRTGGDVALMIQALNAPKLDTLRQATLDLMKQEGELLQTLLPRHPQVLAVQKQIAESKSLLSNEVSRAGNALKADLEATYDTEKTLISKVEGLRQATSGLSAPAQTLREAERDVEAQKALYTSLLLRSNDTRESLDPVSASLIMAAQLPSSPQGLPLSLWAGLGLLLGAMVGALRSLSLKKTSNLLAILGLQSYESANAKILSFSSVATNPVHATRLLEQAKQAAKAGKNCLLIEADKSLALSQLILKQPQAGLSEWLRGDKTLDEVVIYDTNTGLCFLPYGLSEIEHGLTPTHLARLKLFSTVHINAGQGETLEALALLKPHHVLLCDKEKQEPQQLALKKNELQAKGVQLTYGLLV
jgi:uncharacterized protein involved in exopolysaccharide biosynthesis